MENSDLDFITVINSVLLLIDYQPNMLKGVGSGERSAIKVAAVASAKAASMLAVPVVYTAVYPDGNGDFINELTDIFPKKVVINRSLLSYDAFEDNDVLITVKKSGRKKLIMSGINTSTTFANTAIHAIREGFEVFGLMDASGDVSGEAQSYGVQKMLGAGVIPITWKPLISDWMNGWANTSDRQLSKELYGKYNAMHSF